MKNYFKKRTLPLGITLCFLIFQNACGLLVGNVKPVEEKAEGYRILDLSKENPDWTRIESPKEENSNTNENSDITYQSHKTSSIISLNTACRKNPPSQSQDLHEFTKLLLLGISDISLKTEKNISLQETPALETTLEGKMNDEPMKLRTIVLKKRDCIYDLMYISRPQAFLSQEGDFSRFAAELRLK